MESIINGIPMYKKRATGKMVVIFHGRKVCSTQFNVKKAAMLNKIQKEKQLGHIVMNQFLAPLVEFSTMHPTSGKPILFDSSISFTLYV